MSTHRGGKQPSEGKSNSHCLHFHIRGASQKGTKGGPDTRTLLFTVTKQSPPRATGNNWIRLLVGGHLPQPVWLRQKEREGERIKETGGPWHNRARWIAGYTSVSSLELQFQVHNRESHRVLHASAFILFDHRKAINSPSQRGPINLRYKSIRFVFPYKLR